MSTRLPTLLARWYAVLRSTMPPVQHTSQRAIWNGPPERLPDAFCMQKRKGDRVLGAVCETWSHQFGWELRLMIDGHGLQLSSVVRSATEMNNTADSWRAAMLEKGWT
jgi:hypothetical protein